MYVQIVDTYLYVTKHNETRSRLSGEITYNGYHSDYQHGQPTI